MVARTLPPDQRSAGNLPGEKRPDQLGDRVTVFLEREVARLEEVKLQISQILLVRMGSLGW
ncbi:MAG: hypothetical protein IH830_07580, partial [Planctomycetes bacterium]|nr:hypothetical protein [Planctomycetota bacterium]